MKKILVLKNALYLFLLVPFIFQSCAKDILSDNEKYIQDLFIKNKIKSYKIDKSIVNSKSFNLDEFVIFFNSKIAKPASNHKSFIELMALAIAFYNDGLPSSDVSLGGKSYSCTAIYGGEKYYFYRGPGGSFISNIATSSTWTTNYQYYNSSTNKYTFIGYDTYTAPLGITWNSDYRITMRRVGNTCYFTRTGLVD